MHQPSSCRGMLRSRTGLVIALASSATTAARAFCSSASAAASSSPTEANGARTRAHDWDADRYSTNAGFVPELGIHVLDILAPRRGERILDVGCGDGVLTAEIKARGCKVMGIDFAPDMIAAAVKRDVEAYVMDASAINAPFLLSKLAHGTRLEGTNSHNNSNENTRSAPPPQLPSGAAAMTEAERSPATAAERGGVSHPQQPTDYYRGGSPPSPPVTEDENGNENETAEKTRKEEGPPAFDAVFTNAALHWVRAPRTVIEGVKRVLRPGGRFVGEFGGHGNMAAVRVAMHATLWRRGLDPLEVDPWYFPTPHEYRRLLEAAGFIVDDVWLVPRPTILPAGTGMRGWLSTFTQAFLNAIPENSSSANPETDANGLTKTKAVVVDEALAALQPALRDKDGVWTADYVRLRFRAHLPHDSASGTALDGNGSGVGAAAGAGGAGAFVGVELVEGSGSGTQSAR